MSAKEHDQHSDGHHQPTAQSAALSSPRRDLLEQNEEGDHGDPQKVHDATEEEQAHERPAAADAEGAVLKSHVKRSARAVPPVCGDELDRRPTVAQARPLVRRPLIYAIFCAPRPTRPKKRDTPPGSPLTVSTGFKIIWPAAATGRAALVATDCANTLVLLVFCNSTIAGTSATLILSISSPCACNGPRSVRIV